MRSTTSSTSSGCAAFLDHGRFIERHFEHYSSPYNHLIGEAAALYMLGAGTAGADGGAAVARGRDGGADHAARRAVLRGRRHGGAVHLLSPRHRRLLSARVPRRRAPSATSCRRASGRRSSAGSISASRSRSRTASPRRSAAPTTASRSGWSTCRSGTSGRTWRSAPCVFERPDFKAIAGRFHEDALWLLGTDGLRAFERAARC